MVWSYDKADYTIRMDVETGMFEDVLLAAMLGGGPGGMEAAGMSARGMSARGMSARGMSARGMSARGMSAREAAATATEAARANARPTPYPGSASRPDRRCGSRDACRGRWRG